MAIWIGATVIGWGLAYVAGDRMSDLHTGPAVLRILAVQMLICGAIVGIFQWLAARRGPRLPAWWIPAAAFCYVLQRIVMEGSYDVLSFLGYAAVCWSLAAWLHWLVFGDRVAPRLAPIARVLAGYALATLAWWPLYRLEIAAYDRWLSSLSGFMDILPGHLDLFRRAGFYGELLLAAILGAALRLAMASHGRTEDAVR